MKWPIVRAHSVTLMNQVYFRKKTSPKAGLSTFKVNWAIKQWLALVWLTVSNLNARHLLVAGSQRTSKGLWFLVLHKCPLSALVVKQAKVS